MREVALGVGVILLFASVIVFPISLQTVRDLPRDIRASREDVVYPDWTVSAAFSENEILLVYFYPPPKTVGVPAEPEGARYMFVDIMDPHGGNTTFNVTFTQYSQIFELLSNDDGLVVDENPSTYIGGKTRYNGTYTARVRTIADPGLAGIYYDGGKIRLLEIYMIYEIVNYPYFAAFPVAIALAAVGVVAIVWGARGPKRRTRPKRARAG